MPPAARQTPSWGDLPGKERAKYLFRIARILQERSREFAVLESMDSGKPIKESARRRRAARRGPLLVLRGLGGQARVRVPGPRRAAAGRRRADHPLELPAADAGVEDRAGARRRQHRRPQARVDDAAVGAPVRRGLPPGRPAAGRRQHRPRARARSAWHLVTHQDVDKVAFTGSTEVGKRIHRAIAGTDKALTLELGGKAANIVFEDAALDQAVEGIVNGIYFNQGEVCCAGSRLLVQESVADALVEQLKDRLSTLRVGDPLDKNTDVGAINSKRQLEKITELVAAGEAEGAELYQPACDLPERGWFFRPTLFTNVAQSHRIAQEEIFGPVLSVLTFRTPDEAVEKANNTRLRPVGGIWTEKGSRILAMVSRAGRRRLGEHLQPVRPDFAVRRLQGVRLRARGRHTRPARLRPPGGPLMAERRATAPTDAHAPIPAQDVQAVRRRAVPADRERALVPRPAADGDALANACPRVAQGRARRGPDRARGAFGRLGRQDRDEPRPGPVPRRRAAWRAGPTSSRRGRGRGGHRCSERRASFVGRAIDRWVWYAGWADKIAQVLGSSNPVGAPYFNFTIPEPTGVVGVVAPERASLLGLVSRLAPVLAGGNVRSCSRPRRGRCPRSRSARCSPPPTSRPASINLLTGRRPELVPVLAAHVDVDALDGWGIPDDLRTAAEEARRGLRQARRPPPDAA